MASRPNGVTNASVYLLCQILIFILPFSALSAIIGAKNLKKLVKECVNNTQNTTKRKFCGLSFCNWFSKIVTKGRFYCSFAELWRLFFPSGSWMSILRVPSRLRGRCGKSVIDWREGSNGCKQRRYDRN